MSEYTIQLSDPWFDLVRTGQKIYEGRCYWKKVLDYKINDILLISPYDKSKTDLPYKVKIVDILLFDTFESALKTLDIQQVLPNVKTLEEGVEIYKKYVSLKTQQENKISMLKIELII